MDPRDITLTTTGVNISQANNVTGLPNEYDDPWITPDTVVFVFNDQPVNQHRSVSTGDRKVYLRYINKLYFSVSKATPNTPDTEPPNYGWGEQPDNNEGLKLQWYGYSGNGVLGWIDIKSIEPIDHSNSEWVQYIVDVPSGAKTYGGVKLRFYQGEPDSYFDNWAVTALLARIGGTQGLQGLQGAQGLQGTQGVQGPLSDFQGTQGNQAAQGIQGRSNQGAQGVQNGQGTQGTQGFQGLQGLQGLQGVLSNFQGTQGTQGVQALQGTSGTDNVSVIFLSMIF